MQQLVPQGWVVADSHTRKAPLPLVKSAGGLIRLRPLVAALCLLALVSSLSISANLLAYKGVPYSSSGGPPIVKFHPATYFVATAFAISLIKGKAYLRLQNANLLLSVLFFSAMIAVSEMMTGHGNVVVLIDSVGSSLLLALVMFWLDGYGSENLLVLAKGLLFVNAIIAAVESLIGANLIPLYVDNAEYIPSAAEFRPTALADHPLTGAAWLLIGLLMPVGTGPLGLLYRAAMIVGLVAFGERSALAVVVIVLCCRSILGVTNLQGLRTRSVSRRLVRFLMLCSGATILTVGVLFLTPIGNRIVAHSHWDDSANTRLRQWSILERVGPDDMAGGLSREQIAGLIEPLRLQDKVEVVENFLLIEFLGLGLIGFPLFCCTFILFIVHLHNNTNRGGRWILIAVLALCFTSNSLGRKSTLLLITSAVVLALRPSGRPWPLPEAVSRVPR